MSVDETISLMAENWFLREPVFYSLFCRLERRENAAITCPIRVGQGRLEYNPLLLARLNYRDTELQFRTEMIRLLLRHPYQRRPEGCSDEVVGLGSNITIGDNYCFLHTPDKLPVQTPEAYHLPLGMHYEWYCRELSRQQQDSQQPDAQNQPQKTPSEPEKERFRAMVELWQEDELREEQLNTLIEQTDDWGDMPAELVSRIRAAAARRIPRRAVLDGFRASVLGNQRLLTRFRPNRRTGWQQMGARREYSARILVAIDVSCSVSDRDVASFLATVERLFACGVCRVDWLTFDTAVSEVSSRRPTALTEFTGRGGTNFQPVLDYATDHPVYDGLIVLTDGHAPAPVWKNAHHPHLLWALTTLETADPLRPTGRVYLL